MIALKEVYGYDGIDRRDLAARPRPVSPSYYEYRVTVVDDDGWWREGRDVCTTYNATADLYRSAGRMPAYNERRCPPDCGEEAWQMYCAENRAWRRECDALEKDLIAELRRSEYYRIRLQHLMFWDEPRTEEQAKKWYAEFCDRHPGASQELREVVLFALLESADYWRAQREKED